MVDRPFGDLGARRQERWAALGPTWSVNFDNTYVATLLVKHFIAALQIAFESHAGRDLGIAPSHTTIDIAMSDDAEETAVGSGGR
ncbi:hypothetical protein [Ancylobacter amanitiformis]|uniref:Uncharacterized protein n=1 Tax=Ancylobacter amanitiformis TaxID=217069 RepID=A0ABU0LUJ8_9HYPH|nr:hypothetical protein [Ancylobacter amanitiformis]MDQ0512371.1 hypothetical protein [Ancylobacter amanitiformis]